MKVLVTGGTGKVGSQVVNALLGRGASVRVLTRNQEAKLPDGVEVAVGDLQDTDSVLAALDGADKLFLLVANAANELTQALLTFALARRTKVEHLTYLSVYQAERFPDVPHFIGKHAVEMALKAFDTPFTILRPGYFFQNDAALKAPLTGPGLYPAPIGTAGIAAVDVRDIAAAAVSLTTNGHAGKTYNLVGPAPLSGRGLGRRPGQAGALRRTAAGRVRGAAPADGPRLASHGAAAHVPGIPGARVRPCRGRRRRVDDADRPRPPAVRGLRPRDRHRVGDHERP
jgi:uncharacterized protein YbjT (DUF2867 family)